MTGTEILNRTPHPVTLETPAGPRTFYPTGTPVRLNVASVQSAPVVLAPDGIPITVFETRTGQAENLPEARAGVALIVAQMVCAALPHRRDLYFPNELVRDSAGNVIAARSLGQVSSDSLAVDCLAFVRDMAAQGYDCHDPWAVGTAQAILRQHGQLLLT